MSTKKFWCHYIGSDGKTPKRRQIELTAISDLLPNVSNEGAVTPLWYDADAEGYNHLYAQLSDTVAVNIPMYAIRQCDVDEYLTKTDDAILQEHLSWLKRYIENHPDTTPEERAAREKNCYENAEGLQHERDRKLNQLQAYQNLDEVLLSGRQWISVSFIKGYAEVNSPYLPVLQVMRDEALAEREAESQRRRLEELHERQEEERKRKEEEVKERERVIGEGAKFRDGEMISGSDVAELCRMCGISVHLRTLHNLQQVIYVINGKGNCQYYRQPKGKRKPQLDGCYDVAEKLYDYLQEHYNELTKAA